MTAKTSLFTSVPSVDRDVLPRLLAQIVFISIITAARNCVVAVGFRFPSKDVHRTSAAVRVDDLLLNTNCSHSASCTCSTFGCCLPTFPFGHSFHGEK